MLFPTLDFGIFFCVVFVLAHVTERRLALRKLVLLGASYFFYGFWDWRFCFLLFFDSMVAYAAGLALLRTEDRRARKWIVGIAVAIILSVLGVFKYYGFFVDNFADLLLSAGLSRDLVFMQILLPIGISFFSFHAISYVVDVYRGDAQAERSPLDILLYISFFPQLVAGPIVRAAYFLPQLKRPTDISFASASLALLMILSGLVKKMIVAQYLAVNLVDPVFLAPSTYDAATLLVAAYGYAVQIYCDFSGYTDIAIGIAALFGYHFRPNFNQPYRAVGVQDFWRRWHISLSTWLRDYLYIPARRQPPRPLQYLPQPDADHGARRPLARRRLDLRHLGHAARACAGAAARRDGVRQGARGPPFGAARACGPSHVSLRVRRLDFLPLKLARRGARLFPRPDALGKSARIRGRSLPSRADPDPAGAAIRGFREAAREGPPPRRLVRYRPRGAFLAGPDRHLLRGARGHRAFHLFPVLRHERRRPRAEKDAGPHTTGRTAIGGGAATTSGPLSGTALPPRRGAHPLVYYAMLFSIVLGLFFASDSLVSYCYDLPENAFTDDLTSIAEVWEQKMEDIGVADMTQRVRDFVAMLRGDG